ncbi:hypothetical protein B0T09DRAFT_168235 [Sordaria sp. MPI-SDFR-AT-0083]|nr:hypothetical protein B0T09DRAFT_168235 [Sordaria sp. MPI-SDFR-AT-0083]
MFFSRFPTKAKTPSPQFIALWILVRLCFVNLHRQFNFNSIQASRHLQDSNGHKNVKVHRGPAPHRRKKITARLCKSTSIRCSMKQWNVQGSQQATTTNLSRPCLRIDKEGKGQGLAVNTTLQVEATNSPLSNLTGTSPRAGSGYSHLTIGYQRLSTL